MAYEIDTIRMSQEIFYYLLIHHELKEEEEGRLYRAYTVHPAGGCAESGKIPGGSGGQCDRTLRQCDLSDS